ncbi:TniB family NTP-binding protein [Affinirhizobium pseudoryzae]|uniref:TniB family NTP-binding protein n=1 Tax=Allorhizobium pseudoryzae TaxID=379684 RepID=UPI0013EB6196|nr:TniB family NTP-binding protein [Allorhizobium pseudoryzae]
MTDASIAMKVPTMTPSDRKLHLHKLYLRYAKFHEVGEHLDALIANAKACREGGGFKERALFVIGESNTGKSRMLEELFREKASFQPYRDEEGEWVRPLISIEAPSPCSSRELALKILKELGAVVRKKRISNPELYDFLKDQLRDQKVEYLHIDEMQDTVLHNTEFAIKSVQSDVKSLLQIKDWPLHAIFSGVDELANFIEGGDGQIDNRSNTVRLELLKDPRDLRAAEQILSNIVVKHAGLEPGWAEKDELPARLILAGQGRFGTICDDVKKACFAAIDANRRKVTLSDFEGVYQIRKAPLPQDNPFRGTKWRDILPQNALADRRKPVSKRKK